MKTLLIIIGIVVGIPIILLLVYIAIFAGLGRRIYDNHDENIKQAIGFDFGDKYKLLYSRMRDGMSQVLLFQDDNAWAKLLELCQSMKEGESFVSVEGEEYRVNVSKEPEEYEYRYGSEEGVEGTHTINVTIRRELHSPTPRPRSIIRIDYSNRLVFYDYDSGI